ncbi:MAG: hypothetical protein KJ703_04395, partial [Alphaproteobacteria bacterium]|nr:hypothetical protein [Alphaproteobacteria bacterium]MBU1756216.1 hypothetical protein [Alphaproteobacteria bacterium]
SSMVQYFFHLIDDVEGRPLDSLESMKAAVLRGASEIIGQYAQTVWTSGMTKWCLAGGPHPQHRR